jgi:DNA polymerase-3 subunit beta
MTIKITIHRSALAESLAIVGRAVGVHSALPILSNVLLCKEEGQLKLSSTDLTLGVTVWMDARIDGDLSLTVPAKTLTDVVSSLAEPEVTFSTNGKPEFSIKSGSFKGIVKGIEGSEFPAIPKFDVSEGIVIGASSLKSIIQSVIFAASADESRPVLTGVLVTLDGNTISMVAADGFRLAIRKAELSTSTAKKQLIVPAAALKETARILSAFKGENVTLFVPPSGSQIVFSCEHIQLISQLIDGNYPDYQTIIPKGYKTRTVLPTADLLKACKQAGIIAREASNVVRIHLKPGGDQAGKVQVLAESDETGKSEVELVATVEGQELEIAFNVKFLLDVLDAISTHNVVLETTAHNAPAIIRPAGEDDYQYLLMPMHLDSR